MKAKYGIKEDSDLERKVHQMKVKEYIDVHLSGDIAKYLSEKAEMKVEEALTEIMFGKPGLLLRGLIRNRNTYHHLTKIVGDIPPLHCKCKSEICQLKDECFDMETDLILLYPNGINIYVIIFEVKKVKAELESFNPTRGRGGADSARPKEKLRFWYILVIQLTRKNLTFPK